MNRDVKRYPGELYPCVYKCKHEGCSFWYRNKEDDRIERPSLYVDNGKVYE